MKVEVAKLGYLQTNCYFLIKDNKVLLVDPADEFEKIKDKIGDRKLVGVIVTHNHTDHIGSLKQVLDYYKVDLYNMSNMKEGLNNIDNFNFEVIYTKGHTDDSITIYFKEEKIMFVGDFIFKDTIGRTDLPTGNYEEMLQSIANIKKFSNITIYPGHGDITSLDYEKKNNMYFKI